MKKCFLKPALYLFFVTLSFNMSGQVSRQLDIPGRLQWDNANGYCGETSIQIIALYYGNYISQIINSLGQTVKELTLINSKSTINLTALTAGLYIIKIKTDKEMTTKKFIKKQYPLN